MQVITSIAQLTEALNEYRNQQAIGFVPTMGALHKGHISLVNKSASDGNFTVVSIYVNPTQFNDQNDLKHYPRNLAADCNLLEGSGCKLIFAPTDEEMYPVPDTRKFPEPALYSVSCPPAS